MIFPHFDPQYCYDRMAIWKIFNCELSAEFYAHCFCISKITMNSIKTEWPSWRDRMVVGFTQSVPITSDVVSSNPAQAEVYNIM